MYLARLALPKASKIFTVSLDINGKFLEQGKVRYCKVIKKLTMCLGNTVFRGKVDKACTFLERIDKTCLNKKTVINRIPMSFWDLDGI